MWNFQHFFTYRYTVHPPAVLCLSNVLRIKALNFVRFCMCTYTKGCYPLSGYLIVAPTAATSTATASWRVRVFCCEWMFFVALAFVLLLLLLFFREAYVRCSSSNLYWSLCSLVECSMVVRWLLVWLLDKLVGCEIGWRSGWLSCSCTSLNNNSGVLVWLAGFTARVPTPMCVCSIGACLFCGITHKHCRLAIVLSVA